VAAAEQSDVPAADVAASVALAKPVLVGVLSDTHGHLYPRVAQLLQGVEQIVHAGDVGSAQVLAALRSIAPVVAVRGNCDVEAWATALPQRAETIVGGIRIVVGHMGARLTGPSESGDRSAPGVVISGHSHLASLEWRGPVLYLNPGSAGPRRFGRPRTVAHLQIWPARSEEMAGEGSSEEGREQGSGEDCFPRVTAQILTAEGD
jgi:uncharacterized protein